MFFASRCIASHIFCVDMVYETFFLTRYLLTQNTDLATMHAVRELALVSDASIITVGTLISRLGQFENKSVTGFWFSLSVQQKINALCCLCVKMHSQDKISSVSFKKIIKLQGH